MSRLILNTKNQLVTVEDSSPTISVLWDRAVQQAVINTAVGPTIASRASSMVHTAMYDAWASYDSLAVPTQLDNDLQRPEAEITDANKQEAMSYAAYRVLVDLFPSETAIFEELMAQLGYDPSKTTTDATVAAGIGNLAARALLTFRHQDNSNQLGNHPEGTFGVAYSDISDYQSTNTLENILDLALWTPEYVPIDDTTGNIQQFLTPHWGEVKPFATESVQQYRPEPTEPFLLIPGEVNLAAQTITLADESVVNIDRDLIGTVINPRFIAQATELITVSANLIDEQKIIAEFWEDGAGTSFPPGTWMSFGQFVSARDEHSLDDDVQLFFTLGNAVFDAGIATWYAKTYYDYARPVRVIRELGELGLIGEFDEELGGYAIEAWQPNRGTQTILAADFLTYQNPNGDASPPFAEYTSGHSAFSAAGASVLKQFTGSDDFGASVTLDVGESLFEPELTPTESVTLEWDTFTEAADEAGLSRIYGGIHFKDGDVNGRVLGAEVGNTVFAEAQRYINGEIEDTPELNNPIYRLQNNVNPGAYIFVGETEKTDINSNYPEDFTEEGMAFQVGAEAHQDLIAMYRFQNVENPECYIIVGEAERDNIHRDAKLADAFREEDLAFYVYEGGSTNGSDIYRFRSTTMMGNYLYVTEVERDYILNNYRDDSINEGVAFSAQIN
ncbi:conserved hypothetical protein [Hyella patelloides LEGE 07179]|uniref:Uncharacterized protein n=1 Tax=Hyella patelloides LEGE 07179 TaxID=945734 RepID=A0A563VRP4_9CYAN|nr:vanadium-dependent haloperoxidase [Hyella patelloides]VEP14085.1 conserved hypothetical protein [Hyella patelloides LEGE 07179]